MATRDQASATRTSPATIAAANMEAFNDADWDGFIATLAPDVVYEEVGTGRRIVGADEQVRRSQEWKRALPDVRGTITDKISSGNVAVLTVLWRGTHSGELETPTGPIAPTGAAVEVPASLWYVVEGDRIIECRHYFDMLTLLRQIGAVPS